MDNVFIYDTELTDLEILKIKNRYLKFHKDVVDAVVKKRYIYTIGTIRFVRDEKITDRERSGILLAYNYENTYGIKKHRTIVEQYEYTILPMYKTKYDDIDLPDISKYFYTREEIDLMLEENTGHSNCPTREEFQALLLRVRELEAKLGIEQPSIPVDPENYVVQPQTEKSDSFIQTEYNILNSNLVGELRKDAEIEYDDENILDMFVENKNLMMLVED